MYSKAADGTKGVKYDQIGRLEGHYSKRGYPGKLRHVKYYDGETGKEFVFLTNNMNLEATEIAFLYKKRWEVGLFFKRMKQHLRKKSFWGIGTNAVKVQIYCPIIAQCLVAIVGNKLNSGRGIYETLQMPSVMSTLNLRAIRGVF